MMKIGDRIRDGVISHRAETTDSSVRSATPSPGAARSDRTRRCRFCQPTIRRASDEIERRSDVVVDKQWLVEKLVREIRANRASLDEYNQIKQARAERAASRQASAAEVS